MGNIGSDNTRSYTVIGDTANLAARLERANRVYGTQILVGETTAQAIGSQFEMREIDTISVKGKTETTRILELMSAAGQLSEDLARLRERYEQARRRYLARNGIWRRRFSANVSKFVPMTVRPVSSLNAFRSFAEIHPEELEWRMATRGKIENCRASLRDARRSAKTPPLQFLRSWLP